MFKIAIDSCSLRFLISFLLFCIAPVFGKTVFSLIEFRFAKWSASILILLFFSYSLSPFSFLHLLSTALLDVHMLRHTLAQAERLVRFIPDATLAVTLRIKVDCRLLSAFACQPQRLIRYTLSHSLTWVTSSFSNPFAKQAKSVRALATRFPFLHYRPSFPLFNQSILKPCR